VHIFYPLHSYINKTTKPLSALFATFQSIKSGKSEKGQQLFEAMSLSLKKRKSLLYVLKGGQKIQQKLSEKYPQAFQRGFQFQKWML
jgi:hypothetical protein